MDREEQRMDRGDWWIGRTGNVSLQRPRRLTVSGNYRLTGTWTEKDRLMDREEGECFVAYTKKTEVSREEQTDRGMDREGEVVDRRGLMNRQRQRIVCWLCEDKTNSS